MLLLKSSPYKIKTGTDCQLPFFILLGFCLVYLLFSWGAEVFFHFPPCSLCLMQRYLLLLIAFNGILGVFSQFKTSYVVTCQILLIVLFTLAMIHIFIQSGLIYYTCPSKIHTPTLWNYQSMFCSATPKSIVGLPFAIFNALGALVVFCLFLKRT